MSSSSLGSWLRSLRGSTASRTILLGLLGTSTLGGVALAVTSDVFQYSTVQTGYYNLSPMTFAPQSNIVADGFLNDAQGRQLQLAGPNVPPAPACFLTGLNLPQQAKLKRLDVWYASNTGNNISVRLYRTKMTDGANDLLAQKNSTNTTQARTLMSFAFTNVAMNAMDNQQYTYGVVVCLTNSFDRYFAGRVTYTYRNAGD